MRSTYPALADEAYQIGKMIQAQAHLLRACDTPISDGLTGETCAGIGDILLILGERLSRAACPEVELNVGDEEVQK